MYAMPNEMLQYFERLQIDYNICLWGWGKGEKQRKDTREYNSTIYIMLGFIYIKMNMPKHWARTQRQQINNVVYKIISFIIHFIRTHTNRMTYIKYIKMVVLGRREWDMEMRTKKANYLVAMN